MQRDFKELDLVRIKSTGVIGVIVNITRAGTFDVEKWGNEGPVYFNILREDMEHVDKSLYKTQYWKEISGKITKMNQSEIDNNEYL